MPTVVVLVRAFRHVAEDMRLPRALVTRHLMGRPLGAPGDTERQRRVLLAALQLLEEATEGGTIVEFPDPYRPGRGAM
jgi:hypothetical protein